MSSLTINTNSTYTYIHCKQCGPSLMDPDNKNILKADKTCTVFFDYNWKGVVSNNYLKLTTYKEEFYDAYSEEDKEIILTFLPRQAPKVVKKEHICPKGSLKVDSIAKKVLAGEE